VWRPRHFLAKTFSILQSRYKLVVQNNNNHHNNNSGSSSSSSSNNSSDSSSSSGEKVKKINDHIVVSHVSEILSEMIGLGDGIIADMTIQ
jgi:hypothetical protein